mgnify:CR=1 FL=1
MITKQVSIVNPTGLHARPATDFVHKAKEFDCRITLRRADLPEARAVNGKSLVSVLALGAGAITKWLFDRARRIERAPNVKNIEAYIARVEEMAARKRELIFS